MEYSRAVIIGVHHTEAPHQPQFLIADIILIDQTNQALKPSLYQLQGKSEALDSLIELPKGSFILLGEVLKIDKKKKLVYLSNQSTVQYKHLIIVCKTSIQQNDEAFLLKTLLDALKLQQKAPILLAAPNNMCHTSNKPNPFFELASTVRCELTKNIAKIAQEQINFYSGDVDYIRPEKCLLEVQL